MPMPMRRPRARLRPARRVARFPWGSRLGLRRDSCVGRPVGHCARRPSPACAIVASSQVPSTVRSRPFAWSGRGRVRRRYSRRQLRPNTFRRTSRPAPFQRRGCEQPAVLLGPCAAFIEPCRSLTLSLSPAGTPESVSVPPDALPVTPAFYGERSVFDLRARGPRRHPAGESEMGQSPRMPSVVSRTCEPKPTGQMNANF